MLVMLVLDDRSSLCKCGGLEAIPFEVDSFRKFLPQWHFVPIFDANLVESRFVFDVTCCRYTNHYTVNNLQIEHDIT